MFIGGCFILKPDFLKKKKRFPWGGASRCRSGGSPGGGAPGGGASSCRSCCRLSACRSGTQELLSDAQRSHSHPGQRTPHPSTPSISFLSSLHSLIFHPPSSSFCLFLLLFFFLLSIFFPPSFPHFSSFSPLLCSASLLFLLPPHPSSSPPQLKSACFHHVIAFDRLGLTLAAQFTSQAGIIPPGLSK